MRGEIVELCLNGARHGFVCTNVACLLAEWSRQSFAGYIATNNTGVVTECNPDSVRGPDCLFISTRRLPDGVPDGFLEIAPDLAVEVLSPHDRWAEVTAKVEEYLSCGVLEVWVVDPEEQTVTVFRPDQRPVTLTSEAELVSESVLPGFHCSIGEFFSEL